MHAIHNLFAESNASPDEVYETLCASGDIKIQKIVSWGQSSPVDFWYEQLEGEWVTVLEGEARLTLQAPDETVLLKRGDHLWIAPGRKHRVDWTLPESATIWLAVFVNNTSAIQSSSAP